MILPNWERTEEERKVCKVLEEVAAEVGAPNIQAGMLSIVHSHKALLITPVVAIAYVMQKVPYVFPIVGGRKIEHLKSNIAALDVVLSSEHFAKIESAQPFDIGFPMNFFVSDCHITRISLIHPVICILQGNRY